ncbi:MAG: DUF58 domain-containing protein [Thermoanaerobaculales bacterium]|nr:DUF58 domain-containing protein [Thermoanaerobaculales bacterium]
MRRLLASYLGRPRPVDPARDAGTALRAQVRRLEIRARQAMEAGLTGQYQSAFRGRGLEFEEVRDYRWGDDVRTIDWNVTARTGKLHVKRYREERDLTVLLLVDLSGSTRFGSGVMTVHDLIAEVSSLFALAAARRDRVGAILFDEALRAVIPPRLGWRHGLRVVREVLGAAPAGSRTAFADALRGAGHLLHRRGIVIAVVDRSCPLPRRELLALAARHEVVLVRTSDELARTGLAGARLPVVDAEAGRPGVVRGRPASAGDPAPPGIDAIDLATDADYLPAVRALLERRVRRVH